VYSVVKTAVVGSAVCQSGAMFLHDLSLLEFFAPPDVHLESCRTEIKWSKTAESVLPVYD